MENLIRETLKNLSEEKYRKFSATLIPNVNNILGVRLQLLRKLAKEIAKGDWRTYIETAESEYFEEVMLQGIVLGYTKADIDEILHYVTDFIPKIDNWAICDSFCTGLKFSKEHKERVWHFLQVYLKSNKEYDIRFGVVMIINFYIEEEYIQRVLLNLDNIKHEGYYVKMAVAWALSSCYLSLPKPTMEYLKNNTLDNFTYNKALQKITESLRVSSTAKDLIRSMKRLKSE